MSGFSFRTALLIVWIEDTMNLQRLIACLRVYTMALPLPGRLLPKSCVVSAALMLASAACAVSVCANEYDIIIEKNLFHDQRQKWEMEKSQAQAAQSGSREKQNIDQINLFGTVIKDSRSYAVMRVTQGSDQKAAQRRAARRGSQDAGGDARGAPEGEKSQQNNRPYAVGDFISGYQVFEIRPASVLLQDPYDNKQYEIFMNDSQTERTAVRTEVAQDTPEAPPAAAAGKDQKPPRKPPVRSAPPPDPAASPEFMRQRLEREMIDQENDAASQQAEDDMENMQPMMPDLDEQGQEELERLKSEFEKMRQ
jgi:hypothetical protein